jgi:hypothetical protein
VEEEEEEEDEEMEEEEKKDEVDKEEEDKEKEEGKEGETTNSSSHHESEKKHFLTRKAAQPLSKVFPKSCLMRAGACVSVHRLLSATLQGVHRSVGRNRHAGLISPASQDLNQRKGAVGNSQIVKRLSAFLLLFLLLFRPGAWYWMNGLGTQTGPGDGSLCLTSV